MNQIESGIRAGGIVAILRGDYPASRLVEIGEAIARGGIRAIEITLNSRNALDGIGRLREQLGERAHVGAGTVRTPEDVDAAIAAGAQFLVSPNFDADSVSRSRAANIPHLPGVFTASEVQAAFAAGCGLVKLFPIDALGPAYLRALRAPLDDVGFVAVGGVDEGNLADYIRAGAVAVGVGSSLVRGIDDESGAIISRAERLVEILRQARTA